MKKQPCVVEMVCGNPHVIIVKDDDSAIDLGVQIALESGEDEAEVRKDLQQADRHEAGDWSVHVVWAEDDTNDKSSTHTGNTTKLKVVKNRAMVTIEPADGKRTVRGRIDTGNMKAGLWGPPRVWVSAAGAMSPEEAMELAKLIGQVALRAQQEYLKIPKKKRRDCENHRVSGKR